MKNVNYLIKFNVFITLYEYYAQRRGEFMNTHARCNCRGASWGRLDITQGACCSTTFIFLEPIFMPIETRELTLEKHYLELPSKKLDTPCSVEYLASFPV